MKYILISGGLGNQMFGYAFCLELRERNQNASILLTKNKHSKAYHQGFELDRLFYITKYQGFNSKLHAKIFKIYYQFLRLSPQEIKHFLIKLIGIKIITVKENFIYYPEVFNFKYKHELLIGTWQSAKYFTRAKSEVKRSFEFNESLLSFKSKQILKEISEKNSISIHIRRGDYLNEHFKKGFGNICTENYYSKAIDLINNRIENAFFYIFSDDKEWTYKYFNLKNSHIVNCNNGIDSWQDMYLMSKCLHNIIANSSFSWWAAWLNSYPDKIVIAPKQWWNTIQKDDVVPDDWIRI